MNFIGLDIETASNVADHPEYALQPWRVKTGEARITAISVVDEFNNELFSKLEPTADDLRELLINLPSDAVIVGWNTIFDVAWLIAYGLEDEVRKLKWADAMLYRRCLENSSKQTPAGYWGLKQAVRDFLPEFADYELEVKERNDWSVVDDTLLKYNRTDAYATARLAKAFYDRLESRQCVLCGVVCSSILPHAAALVRGIEINSENLKSWADAVTRQREAQIQTLLQHHGLESEKVLTSPVKLKQWLHHNGFMVDCTDRTELSKYTGNPLIDSVIGFKKANGALTKFIKGTQTSLDYNGGTTVHPQPRIWNTYTGRDGYSSQQLKKFQVGIPIHQWPKRGDKAPRMVIQAPAGYKLAECDFSTQESRLLADFSNDPVLLKIFSDGLDFHAYMASVIDGCSYESFLSAYKSGDKEAKSLRQCAKVVNLSLTYRASWGTLINMARKDYDLIFTEAQARQYHYIYRETYRGVPNYWINSIQKAQMALFAETRGGRRVILDDWSRERSWATESTAINFPIQGTGADMKSLARGIIDPILYRNGGRYLLDLHDALFFLVPDNNEGERLAFRVREILSSLPYEQVFGWRPKVPMPVDLKLGYIWGSLEEVN